MSNPSITTALCTNCGLCCNGTLFADVELASVKEATTLEVMGLNIDEDEDSSDPPLLLQPCTALRNKRCTIYPHRPKCCRTFECRLLQNVHRGTLSLEHAHLEITAALQIVTKVRTLLRELNYSDDQLSLKEQCLEALSQNEDRTDQSLH